MTESRQIVAILCELRIKARIFVFVDNGRASSGRISPGLSEQSLSVLSGEVGQKVELLIETTTCLGTPYNSTTYEHMLTGFMKEGQGWTFEDRELLEKATEVPPTDETDDFPPLINLGTIIKPARSYPPTHKTLDIRFAQNEGTIRIAGHFWGLTFNSRWFDFVDGSGRLYTGRISQAIGSEGLTAMWELMRKPCVAVMKSAIPSEENGQSTWLLMSLSAS